MRDGVIYERGAFANTRTYIYITISANFGKLIRMAGATDNVDPDTLTHPPGWETPNITSFTIVFGLLSTVFDIAIFVVLLQVFNAIKAVFHTSWFIFSILTELGVVWSFILLRTR
ncbi:hypothetical protein [Aliiroseovarius sediminis]|uniref:hypothetical protein n=1 Tax=Aliiroseovarius sediminis TaxID=2925839 RepID=UPI001F5AF12B|nr:hypothetical protein [Aliiroseovarius sediminis]MCI2395990.1 hypothetical protein [Aliiroseovarius sediminis]